MKVVILKIDSLNGYLKKVYLTIKKNVQVEMDDDENVFEEVFAEGLLELEVSLYVNLKFSFSFCYLRS